MAQQQAYELLYDSYFPFRLYADRQRGATLQQLAHEYLMPVPWIEERIESVRLCLENQIIIQCESSPENGSMKAAVEQFS
jgi:hypothetical protein